MRIPVSSLNQSNMRLFYVRYILTRNLDHVCVEDKISFRLHAYFFNQIEGLVKK